VVDFTVLDTICYALIVVHMRGDALLQGFFVALDQNLVVFQLFADSIFLRHESRILKHATIFQNLIFALKLLLEASNGQLQKLVLALAVDNLIL
jgi:hypothetical protein